MARALSTVADVQLVSTVACSISTDDFSIAFAEEDQLRDFVDWAEIVVFQGHILSSYPWIGKTDKIIVADIYDPMHLEQLEQTRQLSPEDRLASTLNTVEVLNDQIARADFMMCASEKQRDFWLGQLAGLYRINPSTYDHDTSLRSLLGVVPFGIADLAPVQKRHGIKGNVPGIEEDDKVVLWGGGIYNWFDPLTLLRAVARLAERRPNLRLFFLGVTHPNPNVPAMEMALRTYQLADELGLTDKVVFFNDGWVPYNDRADYLLDADLGVSTHFDHLETAFSFRTRILDYLWASLPIVSTDGDTFANIIRERNLGIVVPPEDVTALELALESALYDDDLHASFVENVRGFAQDMTWSNALKPLLEFVQNPRRASDDPVRLVTPLRKRMTDLEIRVAGLESSTSWRVTQPLRTVRTKLAQLNRKRTR